MRATLKAARSKCGASTVPASASAMRRRSAAFAMCDSFPSAQRRRDGAPDRSERGVSPLESCRRLGEIDRHDHRGAVGRPEHADVVGGSALAGTGLVAYAPAGGQARAQARIAGLVADEPALELRARGGGERILDRKSVV